MHPRALRVDDRLQGEEARLKGELEKLQAKADELVAASQKKKN